MASEENFLVASCLISAAADDYDDATAARRDYWLQFVSVLCSERCSRPFTRTTSHCVLN